MPGEYEGWDQSANARYLEEQGAAVMLRQADIGQLHGLVSSLIADSVRLDSMKTALTMLRRPSAAEEIADLIAATAGVRAKVSA